MQICAIIGQSVRSSRNEFKAVSSNEDAKTAMTIAKPDVIAGMVKGMAVLESFDTERQRLNATLAAQRAGITRAAARRHLLTLHHLGYLESDGSYFWLAPKVMRFSGSYLASSRLPRVVQPMLHKLAVQSPHSFSVVVLDESEVVIVARSDASRVLAYGLHLGARLPAHATSTGRVLLAAMPARTFSAWLKTHPLARFTAATQTDARRLREDVHAVQAHDYCLSRDEHELGVSALAVPLRNSHGHTVAALNVVLSSAEMEARQIERHFLTMLQNAAQELRPLL
jgi:IclR family pca regulon transcriptional regulator